MLTSAAEGHLVSAGSATRASGLTLINYDVLLLKPISIEKSSNLSIFQFLMRNDDVITE